MVAALMPKATAVWLVENTALSFDQVADFCKLHLLEVKAIADGDAPPRASRASTRCSPASSAARRSRRPSRTRNTSSRSPTRRCGCPSPEEEARYAGVAAPGPSQRHPLVGAQPCRIEGQPDHATGRHHQVDDPGDPRAHPLERIEPAADGPGDARPVLADRSRPGSAPRRQRKPVDVTAQGATLLPASRRPSGRASPSPRRRSRPRSSTSTPCSPSSSRSAAARANSAQPRLRASGQSTDQRPAPVTNSSTWPPIIETFFQNWPCCCARCVASAKSQ